MQPDLFIFLRRVWSFERRICCRISGSEHSASGSAVWSPTAKAVPSASFALSQSEDGTLTLGNSREVIPVRASYIWTWSSDKASPTITFPDDGRIFVDDDIDFLARECRARHECAPDTYEGLFKTVHDGRGFQITWSVTGPSKDYTTITTYLPTSS